MCNWALTDHPSCKYIYYVNKEGFPSRRNNDDQMVLCNTFKEWMEFCPNAMPCPHLNIASHQVRQTAIKIFKDVTELSPGRNLSKVMGLKMFG